MRKKKTFEYTSYLQQSLMVFCNIEFLAAATVLRNDAY